MAGKFTEQKRFISVQQTTFILPMRKLVFVCALLAGFFPVFVQAQENLLLDFEFWETATVEDVTKILDSGADIKALNKDGFTPLHLAARISSLEVISLLLDAGADVNVRDAIGWTPLHLAVASSREVVLLLLNSGADIEARDNLSYSTPLHKAAAFSKTSAIVELLLDRGANAKAQDINSHTPFDSVKQNKHLQDTKAYLLLKEAQYR